MSHNFWGDKTITNLGNNVMKRHETINFTSAIITTFIRYEHTMRKHVLLWVGCNELRLSIDVICISMEEIGVLPWVVCASGIVFDPGSSSMMDDDGESSTCYCWWNWWNSLMRYSEVDWWTTEISFQCNVRLINSIHRWIFCCWMDVFVKTVLLFTEQNVIVSTITDATFFVIRLLR